MVDGKQSYNIMKLDVILKVLRENGVPMYAQIMVSAAVCNLAKADEEVVKEFGTLAVDAAKLAIDG